MIQPSSNSSSNNEIKSSWLNNSTYIPVKIVEYSDEETKKNANYNDVLDSGSDEQPVYKKRKEKKKRHKKIKKREIVKHYLKQIPSIKDEHCQFKKMIFVNEVPLNEREEAFFIDQRGNPYISQYGSVCDKHVPKYRSQKRTVLADSIISERYYSVLKGMTLDRVPKSSFDKKKCDSHCTCQQSFIPVPYDIVTPVTKGHDEQELIDEVTTINESLNKDPHNIAAWLNLVDIQHKANRIGVTSITSSIVVEKKLMIVERALTKNQSNLELHLLRMKLGGEVWPGDKLHKEWNQLLFVWNTNIDVWRFYIDQIKRKTLGFSVDKVLAIYTKCFSTFFSVMSGRMKTKTIDSLMVMELCDLFSDYCDYLTQSGFSERSTASWQLIIEYNFFCGNTAPRQSGNILDDPMLQSLNAYWSSCQQHIGQTDCRGWNSQYSPVNIPCPIQSHLQQIVADTESELFNKQYTESQMWLHLEKVRQQAWWFPFTNNDVEQEDTDRIVLFASIQPSLITLHSPHNLSGGTSSAFVSLQAKKRLLLSFFDHIGVGHPSISIKHNISSNKIRSQQMAQYLPNMHQLSTKTLLPTFIKGCFNQLKGLFDDNWNDDMSLLELSYDIQTHLAKANNWKEALTSIRHSAKSVLSRNSNTTALWIDYGNQLINLAHRSIFKSSEKALKSLFNEATKVIEALHQQISSVLSIDEQLSILGLSLDLIIGQTHAISNPRITALIYQATHILSQKYCLNPPLNTLSSLCLLQSEIITMITSNRDGNSHWNLTLYFYAVSRLLLLNIEPFNAWMWSDCLKIITTIGSIYNWSSLFLYQLSYFLEKITSFFAWTVRCRDLNEGALLQSLLGPFLKTLSQIQTTCKYQIVDLVFTPKLILLCLGQRSFKGGQRLNMRNFLWSIVGSSEIETTTTFNCVSHGTSLLLLNMELERWKSLKSENCTESFTGRSDRVRSAFNRLLALRCMHWRYRLSLWLSMMEFEANEETKNRDDRVKEIFYRSITDMPGEKSLYTMAVSLVPDLVEEVNTILKNNGVRVCAPLEEIKLLLRIKESSRKIKTEDDTSL